MSIVRQNTAFETPEEKKIFWHTSAHIMAQAVLRLFPEAKFAIGPASRRAICARSRRRCAASCARICPSPAGK